VLIYPPGEIVAETRAAPVPSDLLAGQHALAEPARLQILRAIATKARSTEEIADLIGLSQAGTSRHLHVLADAKLATRRREGYYVLYAADLRGLRALTEGLGAYVCPDNVAGSTSDS
jgi:ArsR family transcriptional regulator